MLTIDILFVFSIQECNVIGWMEVVDQENVEERTCLSSSVTLF